MYFTVPSKSPDFLGTSESNIGELLFFLCHKAETGECKKDGKCRKFKNINTTFCTGQNQFGSCKMQDQG